jgi:hypothetical protein
MGERGLRYVLALGAALAATVWAIPVASAGTQAKGLLLPSCGPETTPFVPWGDLDSYCAIPNLGFEDGTAGWTLTGNASVVSGNEPWNVSGAGTHSLSLGPGATALSSPLPISLVDPWIRFFSQSSGANGQLFVEVIFRGPLGNLTGLLNFGSLSPGSFSSWQPTQRILSALALPLGTTSAQVLLVSGASRGNWLVDDVYLDPCVSRVR